MKKPFYLLIFMSLGLLVGCSSGINFNISFDQKGGFGMKEVDGGFAVNTLEFVDTLEELKDLCDEWNNPAFNKNSEYYSSENSEKIRSYDESFFAEKILVIYSFDTGYNKETRIDSIVVDGEQLIINTRIKTKRGTFESVGFNWLMLIDINKSDVEGITSIQVMNK
ncbi:MAG: hypothetical protein PHG08_07520 [Bacilli bacterium]|nr:hypothetical protein [Bacilli bacterium]